MNRNLARYLHSGHRRVHGWLNPLSAAIIASLSDLQVREGWRGGICEIGVHHGKLFLLLALAALPGEKCVAIDVFGRQDLNLDGSGKGDRAIFEANMQRHGVLAGNVQIVEKSSLEVSGAQVRELAGPLRLFSVDGGHTEECIRNDMAITDDCIADHGVIVIDDVFNGSWPSVASGYVRYLLDAPGTVPFAISPNKVYACRPEFVSIYSAHLRSAMGQMYTRSDCFMGFPVDIYGWNSKITLAMRIRRKLGKILRGK